MPYLSYRLYLNLNLRLILFGVKNGQHRAAIICILFTHSYSQPFLKSHGASRNGFSTLFYFPPYKNVVVAFLRKLKTQ